MSNFITIAVAMVKIKQKHSGMNDLLNMAGWRGKCLQQAVIVDACLKWLSGVYGVDVPCSADNILFFFCYRSLRSNDARATADRNRQ